MGTYRVYNKNYSGYGVEDLSSVDFVEVDNTVLNCVKDDNDLYSPSIKKLLNIVNVKVQDIPTFVKRNIILSPQQVVQCATGNDTDYTDGANYMHPNQFKYEQMMEELANEELLVKEDSMTTCDYNDRFFNMLQEAEKYCQTDYMHGVGVTANSPVSTVLMANENYCDNSQYLTSGICMAPSFFDDKPRDIHIDADSIFTSQPKPDVVDNSDLLNISSDTSTLMQGSCLDLFNNKADKFEDFKIREPEHTSPAKLEKQRRIDEYHKRHNRKKNR